MLRFLLYLIIFVAFIFVLVRYIESKSIFYPSRDIQFTPTNIGIGYEDIFFKTKDNVKLNGWFIPFKGAKDTLIFCHGNAGNISHRLEKIAILHNLGINIFIFDYRGYGKSQGAASERGIYLDVQAAYDYLIARPDINREGIISFGSSLGGASAIDLCLNRKVKALIADSTFTSAQEMGKNVYPFIPEFLYSTRFDNIGKAAKITIPKLFIHSINDEIVPFKMGEKLFNAALEPKELLKIYGGHNVGFIEQKELVEKGIGEFLNKYE